jgi:hypothetical protein
MILVARFFDAAINTARVGIPPIGAVFYSQMQVTQDRAPAALVEYRTCTNQGRVSLFVAKYECMYSILPFSFRVFL